jgi:hypothetical protein
VFADTGIFHLRSDRFAFLSIVRNEREAPKTNQSQDSRASQGKAAQRSLRRTIELASSRLEGVVGEGTHSARPETVELIAVVASRFSRIVTLTAGTKFPSCCAPPLLIQPQSYLECGSSGLLPALELTGSQAIKLNSQVSLQHYLRGLSITASALLLLALKHQAKPSGQSICSNEELLRSLT